MANRTFYARAFVLIASPPALRRRKDVAIAPSASSYVRHTSLSVDITRTTLTLTLARERGIGRRRRRRDAALAPYPRPAREGSSERAESPHPGPLPRGEGIRKRGDAASALCERSFHRHSRELASAWRPPRPGRGERRRRRRRDAALAPYPRPAREGPSERAESPHPGPIPRGEGTRKRGDAALALSERSFIDTRGSWQAHGGTTLTLTLSLARER